MTLYLTEEFVGSSDTNSGCLGLLLRACHGFYEALQNPGISQVAPDFSELGNPVPNQISRWWRGSIFKALVAYINQFSRPEL